MPGPAPRPIAGCARQQPQLLRERLRGREVHGLAQRHPQGRGDAGRPFGLPCRRGRHREDGDVLEGEDRRARRTGTIVARDEHVHAPAGDDQAGRRRGHDLGDALSLRDRRAGRGAAARRADERGQQLLAGGDVRGQPQPDERARVGDGAARRIARGHFAHGQRLAPDRAPGREPDRATTTPTLGPRPSRSADSRDATSEAASAAEQQREAGEQQRPATPGHRAIPSAGSSSPIRAPRADGAGARRPPWRRATEAATARP